jgi:lipid II:glycine glycyltransferase (peptidoglycan interpeptide bridge formation enzyme)
VFIDGDETSVYWTGVYDRSLFPKPLAHYGIWLAMERAAERGMTTLELGEVPETGTEKEIAIGRFKKGFATAILEPMRLTA